MNETIIPAEAKSQATVAPEAAGVSPVRLARALDVLKAGIEAGAMPGATVCAFRRGQIFLHDALGTLDGSRPTALNSIYDLASITKPMATGASLLTLVEAGKVLLVTPVTEFLGGESEVGHLAKITLFHLLTHTSGLPAWTACYNEGEGLDAAVAAISRVPVSGAPGTKYEYSCLNFILLARVIETVSGQTLDNFARENVFAPLDLHDTGYKPAPELHDRIAPTISREGPSKNTVLTGVVHDGNARGIEAGASCATGTSCAGVSGNAGLFGTAYDVARFGEALRNPTPHHRLFGQPTTARALQSQIKPEVGGHSLLFFARPNGLCPVGDLLSDQAVGHSGYTGTVLTLDPIHDVTVAVLTNSVYGDGSTTGEDTGSKTSWLLVRRRFLNALAACLE